MTSGFPQSPGDGTAADSRAQWRVVYAGKGVVSPMRNFSAVVSPLDDSEGGDAMRPSFIHG